MSLLSKSEIQNKINSKQEQIASYETELSGLQTDLDALITAYDNIQNLMSEFFELYPDVSYVVPNLWDDNLWKGNECTKFQYDFPEEYSMSLSALASDSLDARDWIGVEMNDVERDMETIRKKIKSLESDIWWFKKELWLAD